MNKKRLVLVLLAVFEIILCNETENVKVDFCRTSECVIAASKIHSAIDSAINPCDDFFKFVCGKYIKNTIIHDRFSDDTYQADVKEKENLKLIKLLNVKRNSDIRAFKLVKSFYRTCYDNEALEVLGNKPVIEELTSLNLWPWLMLDIRSADLDIEKLNNDIFQAGFTTNFLINLKLEGDARDSTRYIVNIEPPPASKHFLDEYYDSLKYGLENEQIKAYYEYMVESALLYGASEEVAKKEMLEVLQFEIEFNNLTLLDDDTSPKTYLTIADLNAKFPYFDWKNFIAVRLGGKMLQDSSEIALFKLNFFENFGKLLQTTSKKVMANYFGWRIIDNVKSLTTMELNRPGLNFYGKVFGIIKPDERWKRCLAKTKHFFSVALAALSARNRKQKQENGADSITQLVKKESFGYLEEVLNSSHVNRSELVRRIANIQVLTGSPKEFFNDSILDDYYEDAEVYEGFHFKSALKMKRFASIKVGQRLDKLVAETIWQSYLDNFFDATFYSDDKKLLFLSSESLTSPNYDVDLPMFANFAGIGREVANYFALIIENEAEDLQINTFEGLAKIQGKRYEQYIMETYELSINGSKASFQIFGDVLSYQLSYKAYQAWLNSTGNQLFDLPGLSYTAPQLYWILSAQQYCNVDRDVDVIKRKILTEYPLNSFRVQNSVDNDFFKRDFQCLN